MFSTGKATAEAPQAAGKLQDMLGWYRRGTHSLLLVQLYDIRTCQKVCSLSQTSTAALASCLIRPRSRVKFLVSRGPQLRKAGS